MRPIVELAHETAILMKVEERQDFDTPITYKRLNAEQ